MGDRRERIREQALDVIERRAAGLPTMYRTHLDPRTQWSVIALDPATQDLELLGAALTLARLDASYQPVWKRRHQRDLFAAIDQRIAALETNQAARA